MWIRSAFWVGQAKPGMEEKFETLMNRSVVPGLCSLPGVRDAKALWPRKREDNPPNICCQIVVDFASRADVDQMLASPERAALRPKVLEAIALFDGQFSHIDYEVGVG
jgi:hypothetical protein